MQSVKGVVDGTTFPFYYIIGLLMSIIELNHKFKFESLAWFIIDQHIWYLCYPLVTICPFHLHATSATVFIGIPFAEKIWRSKKPQVLAKLGLIMYLQDEFLYFNFLRLEACHVLLLL